MKSILLCLLLLSVACAGGVSDSPIASASTGDAGSPKRSLEALCKQHDTDKCASRHNYVDLYETFFNPRRDHVGRLLEIGVLEGDSLRLWEAYFPAARIFGLDIADTTGVDTDRITTFVADQGDRAQLEAFITAHGSGFDIMIDDGGHRMDQQHISFGALFPHVQPGGLYIIEDVHTSFPDLYPDYGVYEQGANSTFTMVTNFVSTGRFESQYLRPNELDYLTDHVEHCLYSYRANELRSAFLLCQKRR